MAITLIDKIKPKNNGGFALVDAADVEMPDGTRLSDADLGGKAELPAVSGADDGKVLTVDGGAWTAKTPEQPEIPDPLPEVTAADDGKVLTVDGGTWTAKLPVQPDGGSGSGLPAVTISEIVPEQSVTLAFNSMLNVFFVMLPSQIPAFTAGRIYDIRYNGQDYQCKAESFQFSGQALVGFGDTALATNNAWTGDVPFLCAVFPPEFTGEDGYLIGFAADVQEETTANLHIYEIPDNGKILQIVDGQWQVIAVSDSAVASYVDDYISSALGGDY